MGEIVHLNVTGQDHPGLTAALTETLVRANARLAISTLGLDSILGVRDREIG